MGCRFSVFYDPGEDPGEEVYSFQGSVREKNDQELEINYTYQEEWDYGHSVCYGMIRLDMENRRVLRYSLHDKYDDCFEPSADSMFGTFNECDHIILDIWYDDQEPDYEYYLRAEWVDVDEDEDEDDEDEDDEDDSKMGG